MGMVPSPCPCSLPCHKHKDSQEKPIHLHPESSSTPSSLTSQHSLPSVPSLSSPSQPHHQIQCLLTVNRAHSSYVSSLSVSKTRLYSGSSNGEIRAWTTGPMNEDSIGNYTVTTGRGSVKSMVVLGDDKLISGHQDHKIRVWKIQNGHSRCIATLPIVKDRFARFFCPNNYVELRRHRKSTWVHHVDAVSALALSQDGTLLYSASWDRTFKIWRTSDFRCLESVPNAHEDAINAIAVSKHGSVYTGSADKKIKVWKKRPETSKRHSMVALLEKHQSSVNALAVTDTDDGVVLYSGACDRSILVWETNNCDPEEHMALVGALRGHGNAILCLEVVSGLVFSGSADRTIRVWRKGMEKNGYSCLGVLEGHSKPVKCLSVVVDDDEGSCLVYTGGLDCNIKVWKVSLPLL